MTERLRWGILATGRGARQFATALAHAVRGRLVAVASRAPTAARPCGEFAHARVVHGYDALLADPEVDAVYIATPHPEHARWVARAAAAGKHVLCEKPLAMTAAEARGAIDAARRAGVFLMEGFAFRLHPSTHRLIALLREGTIGRVRMVQATFGYAKPYDPASRYFAQSLGGGAILDVGGYCMAMARLVAGVALGEHCVEPLGVRGAASLTPTGVDRYAVAELVFPGEILAQLCTANSVVLDNRVRIFGTRGEIELTSPWFCSGKRGGVAEIIVRDAERREVVHSVETTQWLFAIGADAVAASLPAQQVAWPGMRWDDTLSNMRALDAWRAAVGVRYAADDAAVQNAG
jgi:predicted dehydrogenase